ncbi:MAG TPA: HD domain-containing protein [Peptococcaceae bacterium]|jgi:metal-dependent HD superfamily phosphatase/phosphodiesterase|nr:HD domain-containing protein [Clostridia bacterium]HOB82422.1 HD domain-containing protein [Peptococcaceae bacterium]HPZ70745.1 HD domain-containing protein [Peptococcaceae bacterium]HQD54395.1 HD domain-containing protein [Peptococcaceae bacterium]
MTVTLETIKQDPEVQCYIKLANQYLNQMGFTEHGFRHVNLVAEKARAILTSLRYPAREAELGAIAGYLHDLGNVICRSDHNQTGAILAFHLLNKLGMDPGEIGMIIAAIGNHDEGEGQMVNSLSAALVLADKTDVHRERVRNQDFATFDIHDRVNYAVESSSLEIDGENRVFTLVLEIDQRIVPVIEYFEIFMSRMLMCRRAANFLDSTFSIVINGAKLL